MKQEICTVKNECQLEENLETPDHLSEALPSSCEASPPAFVRGSTTLLGYETKGVDVLN